jgi:hypothetical protein
MNNQPTPETDTVSEIVGMGHFMVDSEFARKLERERDEARRKLDVTAIHSCHNECQRPICVLRRERDEAREYSKATWQCLRDSQDEVLRLTFENRELRNLSNE